MTKIPDVRKFWEVAQEFVYMRYFFAVTSPQLERNTMKTNYRMTTDLQVVEDYLGDAVIIAFDFETAPAAAWRDDQRAALDPHRGVSAAGPPGF